MLGGDETGKSRTPRRLPGRSEDAIVLNSVACIAVRPEDSPAFQSEVRFSRGTTLDPLRLPQAASIEHSLTARRVAIRLGRSVVGSVIAIAAGGGKFGAAQAVPR